MTNDDAGKNATAKNGHTHTHIEKKKKKKKNGFREKKIEKFVRHPIINNRPFIHGR